MKSTNLSEEVKLKAVPPPELKPVASTTKLIAETKRIDLPKRRPLIQVTEDQEMKRYLREIKLKVLELEQSG